jgi:hypothetical protein
LPPKRLAGRAVESQDIEAMFFVRARATVTATSTAVRGV